MPRVILSYDREPREGYTGFIRSWFFWGVFVFIINQINTARGLDNGMRVTEE
jgi:hypothetical protein